MTQVAIGLAGYGRGGRYFHAPLIGLAPECVLAAVVTQNPRRRAELAQDLPGVPAVDSLGDLPAAGKLLAYGQSPADPQLDPAELAALTTVCSTLLSLDETISKN